ncbi:MAG: YggS family pyridoxal phosphate-dependent enzyme [Bacteroidetes bacterium]|nr:YggS family pyridoxal phosphate-dependent enzyme [Bacteroidota bacterium]
MSNFDELSSILREKNVTLVAVSKTRSIEEILALYNCGQRDFGENRVQEMRDKYEALPKDIRWHLIGHLQTNKVKYIAEWVHLIHSVDSLALLEEINKQAQKHNRIIPCLLQVYIASEETKFGLDEDELITLLKSDVYKQMQNIAVVGLMGMATNTENVSLIRNEFSHLVQLFDKIKANYFGQDDAFRQKSMGMSSDYTIAVEIGSTMVRIGSLLFGERMVK